MVMGGRRRIVILARHDESATQYGHTNTRISRRISRRIDLVLERVVKCEWSELRSDHALVGDA